MKEKRCIIPVNEVRAIGSDHYQWVILRRAKTLDKETNEPTGEYGDWNSYSYWSSFEKCCKALMEEMIRMSGSTSVAELKQAAEEIHIMILDVLEKGKLL